MDPQINKNDITITNEILESWQNIVNTMAEILNLPAALIMKVDYPYIEVFSSSESDKNPYEVGDREHLSGLYCEDVIKRKDKLLIPNAKSRSVNTTMFADSMPMRIQKQVCAFFTPRTQTKTKKLLQNILKCTEKQREIILVILFFQKR